MIRITALLLLLTGSPRVSAAEASVPPIERLRLGVRDLPAALAWLDKVLGWKPTFRTDSRALLAATGAKFELDAAKDDSTATLALASDDVDADYQRLLERGAVSLEAPSDRPTGFREAYVRGPGALTLEIDGPLSQSPEFVLTEIKPGTGQTPKPTDTVKVHYVGSLKDGPAFDQSHREGRPAMVPLPSAANRAA